MIRHPPAYVPADIASAAEMITQVGGLVKSAPRCPDATSASAMIPIVFCASFVPCVSATKPPEMSCPRRKTRLTFAGDCRLITQTIEVISRNAIAMPANGAISDGFNTFCQMPAHSHDAPALRHDCGAHDPADQRMARARGQAEVPRDQVPGDRADKTREEDVEGDRVGVDDPLGDGCRDLEGDERADEVENGRHGDGGPRGERPGRHARRDRVGRIVEAVREVEEQCDRDHGEEREVSHPS